MKKRSLNWAIKILILSISLSICFSVISQSIFPNLPALLSMLVIVFFIALSVIFDMIGVAVTTINTNALKSFDKQKGFKTAMRLCEHREKISSFCGDVVGDICGILSGAGGVSLVLNMHIYNANIYFIVTCLVSSLIAGLTIFGKAICKGYAVENCEKVVMATSKLLETSPFAFMKFKKFVKKSKK